MFWCKYVTLPIIGNFTYLHQLHCFCLYNAYSMPKDIYSVPYQKYQGPPRVVRWLIWEETNCWATDKMTTFNPFEWNKCHFLYLLSLYQHFFFFLAWDKSRGKWDNGWYSTQKMRTQYKLKKLMFCTFVM